MTDVVVASAPASESAGQSVPVVSPAVAGQSAVVDFFGGSVGATEALAGPPDDQTQGVSAGPGSPKGILVVPRASLVVLNVPPARQYDLIADLLDVDMLKLYSDIC